MNKISALCFIFMTSILLYGCGGSNSKNDTASLSSQEPQYDTRSMKIAISTDSLSASDDSNLLIQESIAEVEPGNTVQPESIVRVVMTIMVDDEEFGEQSELDNNNGSWSSEIEIPIVKMVSITATAYDFDGKKIYGGQVDLDTEIGIDNSGVIRLLMLPIVENNLTFARISSAIIPVSVSPGETVSFRFTIAGGVGEKLNWELYNWLPNSTTPEERIRFGDVTPIDAGDNVSFDISYVIPTGETHSIENFRFTVTNNNGLVTTLGFRLSIIDDSSSITLSTTPLHVIMVESVEVRKVISEDLISFRAEYLVHKNFSIDFYNVTWTGSESVELDMTSSLNEWRTISYNDSDADKWIEFTVSLKAGALIPNTTISYRYLLPDDLFPQES